MTAQPNENRLHEHGTYAALEVSAESTQEIIKKVEGSGVQRANDYWEFHCTLIYSRTPFPQAMFYDLEPSLFTAYPLRYEEWRGHDGKNYLVLLVESDKIREQHELFVSEGASHDYDEYRPHITITDNWDSRIPVSSIQIPDNPITFDLYTVRPLDTSK